MSRRLHGWRSLLDAGIERKRLDQFEWGRNDCALFAADLVKAMTGLDCGAGLRGKYQTALGAARIMRNYTRDGFPEFIARLVEVCPGSPWPEIDPILARTGDCVLARGTIGPTLGVRYNWFIAAPATRGVVFLPVQMSLRAWAV